MSAHGWPRDGSWEEIRLPVQTHLGGRAAQRLVMSFAITSDHRFEICPYEAWKVAEKAGWTLDEIFLLIIGDDQDEWGVVKLRPPLPVL